MGDSRGGGGREVGVRCAALSAAARALQGRPSPQSWGPSGPFMSDADLEQRVLRLADRFASYIRTGRVPEAER